MTKVVENAILNKFYSIDFVRFPLFPEIFGIKDENKSEIFINNSPTIGLIEKFMITKVVNNVITNKFYLKNFFLRYKYFVNKIEIFW